MDNRIDALYGRQSVDKADSISIESQLDFCRYELKGVACKEYTDKGYSGKNTERPQFQQLLRDIEKGLIKRVIVYKLDRISRSIIDFASLMDVFKKYDVEFVSSTEKFDTSTPMGRAMLNICIVFAQLERETIQTRVTDAYYSRCKKGFKMGGKTPFGFDTEPIVMEGIHTKRLIAKPEEQDVVRLLFEMYAEPETSLGDLSRYLLEHNVHAFENGVGRATLSYILRNPIYVQADLDIYEFFKGQGALIENDAADFAGLCGCYLYQGRDNQNWKGTSPKGHYLVVAPHEGIVSSDVWLKCRRKLMANKSFDQTGRKIKNTWLSGKTKCGRCGYGLAYYKPNGYAYLRCRKRVNDKSCEGCGTIRVEELEQAVYDMMVQRIQELQSMNGTDNSKQSPKLIALKAELAQVESEIENLIDSLIGASSTLLSYANKKIEELDLQRQMLAKSIADMTADTVAPGQILRITECLDDWDNVSLDDKRQVLGFMASTIRATSENVAIEWKI